MPADATPTAIDDPRADFYEQHRLRLAGFVRRRVSNAAAAEDIVQRTWAGLFERWHTHRDPAAVLFGIASRRVIDWYEASRTDPTSLDDVFMSWVIHSRQERLASGQPPDPAQEVPMRVDLQRALARLAPRQRQVMCLRYVDDLTRQQIAAVLGIGEETIKGLLADATKALKFSPALAGYQNDRPITMEARS